jgi:hypothetical protein
LSAWRIAGRDYLYALQALCSELESPLHEMRSCTTSEGILIRDPEQLPIWAYDIWTVFKNVFNFMLSALNEVSEDYLDAPQGVLTGRLIADMNFGLTSSGESG